MAPYLKIAYLLLIYSIPTNSDRRYYSKERGRAWRFSSNWPQRILNLMVGYYEDVARKTATMQHIRLLYEESAQYEMGYIMGEIVERYRKMVENLKRPQKFRSDAVYVTIKRIGLVQMLYFEIYHLVNMMHEIPLKYGIGDDVTSKNKTGRATTAKPFDNKQAQDAQQRLILDRQQRERRKKQKLREMKKMRDLMLKGQYHTEKTVKPKNKWWPIDYGWEIDYYW